MALDFVGMDPETPEGRCPAVWADPDSGDVYLRGKTVTDLVKLADMARNSPEHADETTVKMPASMRQMIAEAATGTYQVGQTGHGDDVDIPDLLAVAKRTAVHLEMRDSYDTSHPAFQHYLAGTVEHEGHPAGWYPMSGWGDTVREARARGVAVRRARVVSEPVSDYIAWEHMLTANNVEAGEDVRWLPRSCAFDLWLPGSDFWLFDNTLAAFCLTAGDGTAIEELTFTNDPDVIARCLLSFEQVWERATPHVDYRV